MNEKPINILLVEDNPGDIRLTQEIIKDIKINNIFNYVTDGVSAIKYIKKEGEYLDKPKPDLILLDLNLPKKNGIEVLREIKIDENLRTIPIIILSTSDNVEHINKCYGQHANCYITKPFEIEQFSSVIKAIENFWFLTVKLPGRNVETL